MGARGAGEGSLEVEEEACHRRERMATVAAFEDGALQEVAMAWRELASPAGSGDEGREYLMALVVGMGEVGAGVEDIEVACEP